MTPSLPQVSNDHLISQLKSLVLREREMLLEILKYLREVEARQLHLKLGYSSLHAFLTQHLAYSEGAAGRRILAMRLMKSLPEVAPKIKNGELSLSVASQVQGFIQREEKQRKITKHKPLKPTEKLNLLTQLQGTSSRECERRLVQLAPETGLPKEKTRPLSEEKSLIQFVAGCELIQKLEKLKSLTSHSNPEGKYELLFSRLADLALEKLDPERRAKRREERDQRRKAKENHPVQSHDSSRSKPMPNTSRAKKPNLGTDNLPNKEHLEAQKKSTLTRESPRPWAPCGARGLGGSPHGKAPAPPPNPMHPKQDIPALTPAPESVNNPQKDCQSYSSSATPAPERRRSRFIPQGLQDKIRQRDRGRCQYRDPKTGQRCHSNYQLELDHRYPFSLGGEHSEKNLRLYCRRHNRFRYFAAELGAVVDGNV